MKSVATEVLFARVSVPRSLRPSRVRAGWLGAVACSMGFACALSEDTDRKFDIATSHADTDDKGDAQADTQGNGTDAGSTTSTAKTQSIKDVSATEDDVNPHPTDEDPTDDSSTETEHSDASNDTSNDDSNDTSVTSGTTASSTSDDSEDESSGSSGDPSEDGSSDTTNQESGETTQDTVDESGESGDTSVETSEDTSSDTRDDTGPLVPSDIADLVWATGGVGTGQGLFDDARFLAADGDGNVYVGEYESDGPTRIQVFDTEGEFVRQWFTAREGFVEGMAGTSDGHVFILQGGYVDRYLAADGTDMTTIPVADSFDIDAIAAAPDDGLVVVRSERITRLSPEGGIVYDNEDIADITTSTGFFNASGAAVDGSGSVFVIETFEKSVYKFDYRLNLDTQLGVEGDGPGFLEAWPESVATDRYGRIYVADWDGIEVFEPSGGFAGFIELTGAIFAMATNIDDELFVLERNYGQLFKLKFEE